MNEEEKVETFRPCNQADLVIASGYSKWPPRLTGQPIFYPVTNEAYARAINAWNETDFGPRLCHPFFS